MSAAAASSSRTRSTRSASPSTAARRSTSAPRPADSPTCCSSAARRAWSRFDVGHGQLDWGLRNDPRVVVIERANARALEPARPARRSSTSSPSTCRSSPCATSFRACRRCCADGADVVALVKPQFEAGRGEVGKKGVVRDPAVQARVVEEASRAAAEVGLVRAAMTESPITGDTGNREFFLHLQEAAR